MRKPVMSFLAGKVAEATGGTLFQIEPEQPYSDADLDGWNQCNGQTGGRMGEISSAIGGI